MELLKLLGLEHEQRFLNQLRQQGREVVALGDWSYEVVELANAFCKYLEMAQAV